MKNTMFSASDFSAQPVTNANRTAACADAPAAQKQFDEAVENFIGAVRELATARPQILFTLADRLRGTKAHLPMRNLAARVWGAHKEGQNHGLFKDAVNEAPASEPVEAPAPRTRSRAAANVQ